MFFGNMQTGNFGKVREAYAQARQLFPAEVFDYLWSQVTANSPQVLDLGCGTGIATRQLAEKEEATIVGCDADKEMIEEAKCTSPALLYFVAPANKLPFDASSFGMVTAFSAFHWFKDTESLAEIKRVLKEKGQFFIINKNDIAGFRVGYRQKLERLLGRQLTSSKDAYDPADILRDAEFQNVTVRVFPSEERFSPQSALRHIQSAGVWNEVPVEKEIAASQFMEDHITEHTVNGEVVRKLEVVVVRGVKV